MPLMDGAIDVIFNIALMITPLFIAATIYLFLITLTPHYATLRRFSAYARAATPLSFIYAMLTLLPLMMLIS